MQLKVHPLYLVRIAFVVAYLAATLCALFFHPNYYTTASLLIRGFYVVSTPLLIGLSVRHLFHANAFGFVVFLLGLFNIWFIQVLSHHDCEGN